MKTLWILMGAFATMGCASAMDDVSNDGGVDAGRSCGTLNRVSEDADGNRVLFLVDRFNYSFESSLDIQTVDVRAGTDIRFDWCNLTVDMLGRPVDPIDDIDMLEVFLFELTNAELMQKINDDTLSQSDLAAIAHLPTDGVQPSADYLSLLSVGGVPLDSDTLFSYLDPEVYGPERYTFAVMLAEGETLGRGTRMMHLFRPVADETNQHVVFSNDATRLHHAVDIQSAHPIVLPAGQTDIIFDWRDGPIENGMGRPFVPTRITSVMIAHYAMLTLEDLESRFLEIEDAADAIFRADIDSGTAVHLGALTDDFGHAFSGITDEGTWIVALICGDCANPAPWFLSAVEACS